MTFLILLVLVLILITIAPEFVYYAFMFIIWIIAGCAILIAFALFLASIAL